MPSIPADPAVHRRPGRPPNLVLAGLLVAVLFAAYANSLEAPFIFSDRLSVVTNPTIRELHRLDRILVLPGAEANSVGGRPLVNLTLAVNYAVSGLEPWSYHVVNLIIHALATLTLWGFLRRTFAHPSIRERLGNDAPGLAIAVTLLWALHPLLTESVIYVTERSELLVSLCYLLTLYCFLRAARSPHAFRWYGGAFIACLAGMACKEVMVSAPIFVFLYDRALVAGSWREAWRQRRWFYVSLLATWLPLAVLVAGTKGRGGSAGFGTALPWWDYATTQCYAIVHYLRLSVWPDPLVFDYGTQVFRDFETVAPRAALLLLLLGATIWAIVRKPILGLLGAWFFLILAPSSSIVPIATQTMGEQRMYLPLVALLLLFAIGAYRIAGRHTVAVLLLLSAGAGAMTFLRSRVYASEISLWQNVVANCPANFRAHTTLGTLFLDAGHRQDAITQFEQALALAPDNAPTLLNLSAALLRSDRPQEAEQHAAKAVQLSPDNANAHNNLANALVALGQTEAAIQHYETALQLEPDAHDIHLNLAAALLSAGDNPGAIEHYRTAARIQPGRAQTWLDLARAFEQVGDAAHARSAVEVALRIKPEFPEALYILGNLDAAEENLPSAITVYRRALALAPDDLAIRNNLANALLLTGALDEAVVHYQEILRQQPDERSVQENLAYARELQRTGGRAP